ncbi:DUF1614 domain-containing protein [Archaeoglobus veneficus]|uniref:DUF1614 domain-containing protein n=1 Tax=Archaeoglobus veneficus (strain DSM 11195 / SNP6) TaxID=693661 RepID=F2KSL9_ARCVS|nr:DUF1614 domain-containing protein [Archaeoglobus veneficus]AEA48089.1 protein of unknown function DUF1614 [Archaeoglobus veneficus SNP6]
MRDYVFPPLLLPFFLLLIVLPFFAFVFVFATSNIFQIVFGLSYDEAVTVFALIVIGSLINIPIYEKEGRIVEKRYRFFGFIYTIRERRKITVAVNIGGCVIPAVLALRLVPSLPLDAWLLSFAVCTAVIYRFAMPIEGLGIAVPTFLPPLIAAASSYLFLLFFGYPLYFLPQMAFSAGVLSALFGADILHLKDIERIGSGVVSIGGAGTFDGIFLTGIFAVAFSLFFI